MVVAADRMVTASHPSIEFEHGLSKIDVLTNTCVMLSAGDALAHADIARQSTGQLGRLERPAVAEIAEAVRKSYIGQRKKRIEELFLEPRGWDFDHFYQQHARVLPTDLVLTLDNQISTFDYGVTMIIAGTDLTEGHIYGLRHPGQVECYDALGYYAIGIGAEHALASLIRNGCTPHTAPEAALYYVYEAKRAAESAPGVGKDTDLAIIRSDGSQQLDNGVLERLDEIHKQRVAPMTDKIQKQIDGLLKRGEETPA